MSQNAKRSERVVKLLRLAAPTSGATEAERISAALAAAELFAELEDKDKTTRREAQHRDAPEPEPEPNYAEYVPPEEIVPNVESWQRSRAAISAKNCLMCPRPIGVNEPTWRRVNCGVVEWLHDACPRPGHTGL